jgi:hypothetical protein
MQAADRGPALATNKTSLRMMLDVAPRFATIYPRLHLISNETAVHLSPPIDDPQYIEHSVFYDDTTIRAV